ncbi:MAG: NAD(P)(+) transhydrogenase (Re/Si-specific) subunit alpha, partial [bacterium]
MKIGIPKEILEGETRVAVVPSMIAILRKNKHEVLVEAGAGSVASFMDEEYQQSGAIIVKDGVELYRSSEVVLKFQPPRLHSKAGKHEVELIPEGAA